MLPGIPALCGSVPVRGLFPYRGEGLCMVEAVQRGEIARSRFESYCTLYEDAKKLNDWELPGYRQKG